MPHSPPKNMPTPDEHQRAAKDMLEIAVGASGTPMMTPEELATQAEKSRLIQEADGDMLGGPFGHHMPPQPFKPE